MKTNVEMNRALKMNLLTIRAYKYYTGLGLDQVRGEVQREQTGEADRNQADISSMLEADVRVVFGMITIFPAHVALRRGTRFARSWPAIRNGGISDGGW